MNVESLTSTSSDTERWLRFLSRWALVMVFMVLALLVVYLGGIGFAPSDTALGAEYSELLQAVRAPTMYRLAMTFDASGWLMMGGALLTLAIILKNHAPIRALLVAACGMGLLVGVVGGGIRLVGISGLAAQYASSAPAQQTGWFILAGVLSLLQGLTSAIGAFSFPILLLTIVIGILGLHAAIAVAFWRPSAAPVSAIVSA